MEHINSVNTMTKSAVALKASNVAVSTDSVIAKKVNAQSKVGSFLPEEVKENDVLESQKIEDKVSDLNNFVQSIQRGIQFSVHEETGHSIITVTDKETGDVIRSFPSEEVLAVAAYLAENRAQSDDAARGLLVNERT